ncbi:hypothetical protein FOA43_004669 [Brettanomyces nanus]|uniref:Uncharacterized protein n=1 Tax=Eeniella nana TaxID=13502 RepID=A0A875S6Q2_EENNA|nr:uncharacterized protein FOA43_004669 [Brettanomyces nanus]QPG77261.1 hypothetical protein FOA43_004669 [Brettanomyces nanus]
MKVSRRTIRLMVPFIAAVGIVWFMIFNWDLIDDIIAGDIIETESKAPLSALEKLMKKLRLRPFPDDSPTSYSPVSRYVTRARYKHLNPMVGYAGGKAKKDDIFKERSGNVCESIMHRSTGPVDATAPQDFDDPRAKEDLDEYLKSSGYIEFGNTTEMKRWHRFSNSAVWLPRDNCYLMVTRYIYELHGRSRPQFSLCRMQLYDSAWKELFDKRIRYIDVKKEEVTQIVDKYFGSGEQDESLLDKISLKFPTFLDVDMKQVENGAYKLAGPEDPRIGLRSNKVVGDEPLVIFNMLNDDNKRAMFAAFPLRKPDKDDGKAQMTELKYIDPNGKQKGLEKNWTPFFEVDDSVFDHDSFGKMHFVYDFNDMTILSCDLNSGKCEKVSEGLGYDEKKLKDIKPEIRKKIYLRGGTNLIPFPKEFMDNVFSKEVSSDIQLWFGFAKTHAESCGCGSTTYRPNLCVMSKIKEVYKYELLGSSTEFGMDVLSWNTDSPKCEVQGPNVLAANSIAFWDVKKAKSGFEDYMAVTISEGDRVTRRIILKNLANYIASLYKNEKDVVQDTSLPLARARLATDCTLSSSFEHCKLYGHAHARLARM